MITTRAAIRFNSVGPLLGRLGRMLLPVMRSRGVSFRGPVGLTLLAGTTVFVLMPVAHAGRSEHAAQVGSSVRGSSKQVLDLIHDQSLAVERNTHYLEQQAKFSQMLLRLTEKTPANPQQAKQIEQAIRTNRQTLDQVEHNILLSRLHLLSTLPGKVGAVKYLLNKMGKVAPDDRRVALFVLFALQRQQTVLAQLTKILNQEEASTILPGP